MDSKRLLSIQQVHGLFDRRELRGHFGCVNALAFSPNEARLLATGGDDKRVLVWNAHQDPSNSEPIGEFVGHLANIFCICFDSTGTKLYSSGQDGMILKMDLNHASSPGFGRGRTNAVDVIYAHDDSILKISKDPRSDDVLLSSSQDGFVKHWDLRSANYEQYRLSLFREVNSIMYNPLNSYEYVTSDNRGGLVLWDIRNGFKQNSIQQPYKHAVMQYSTTAYLKACMFKTRIMDMPSAVFTPDGKHIGVINQSWFPVIYSVKDQAPLCLLRSLPEMTLMGEHTTSDIVHMREPIPFREHYQSKTTYHLIITKSIKTGEFGYIGEDLHFWSGSEDFRAYAWKLPDLSRFEPMNTSNPTLEDAAFETEQEGVWRVVREVSKPACVLRGHRSIINSVIQHPHLPMICTAGVEKSVKIHQAYPFVEDVHDERESPTFSAIADRRMPIRLTQTLDDDSDTTVENMRTLALFDLLISERDHSTLLQRCNLPDRATHPDAGGTSEEESEDDEEMSNEE